MGNGMKDRSAIGKLAPSEAELREFISDFTAASARMRELRRALAGSLGLTVAEHAVLLGLWYCESRGGTTVRMLADHLHIAAAHVTAEVNKLERAGLIVKRSSETDRRAVDLRLSKRGRAVLDRLEPLLRDVNAALFADLGLAQMRTAHRLFRRIIEQSPEAIRIAELEEGRSRSGNAAEGKRKRS
jgi:DNA-binding MarR family transcriptional regulator